MGLLHGLTHMGPMWNPVVLPLWVAHMGADIGSPWVLEIWREGIFIFRELGSTGNYFQGFEEQANSFRDLGSHVKKEKNRC